MTALGDNFEPGFAPLRDHGYGTLRLRHGPYDEWLDGVSDALCISPPRLQTLRALRHCGDTLAPTPIRDYPPRAARFHGGQRKRLAFIAAAGVWD